MRRSKFLLAFLFLLFALSGLGQTPLPAIPKEKCRTSFPSDSLINWYCYKVKSEKSLEELLGSDLESVLRFNRIDRRHAIQGAFIKVPVNLKDVRGFSPLPVKLEQAKTFPKYIFLDLSEQFLGAYEFGELKFSLPLASGRRNSTPKGVFKILGRDRWHRSSVYTIEKTKIPYPMFWAMKFTISKTGRAVWLHSRDMPGYPASHGCVGLYDEEMQKRFYNYPKEPKLMDSKRLYLWVFPGGGDNDKPQSFLQGLPDILVEVK